MCLFHVLAFFDLRSFWFWLYLFWDILCIIFYQIIHKNTGWQISSRTIYSAETIIPVKTIDNEICWEGDSLFCFCVIFFFKSIYLNAMRTKIKVYGLEISRTEGTQNYNYFYGQTPLSHQVWNYRTDAFILTQGWDAGFILEDLNRKSSCCCCRSGTQTRRGATWRYKKLHKVTINTH